MIKYLKKLKIWVIPKSLSGRFFLIIILPAILIQLITAYLFYHRHWEEVSAYMQKSIIGEISLIEQLAIEKKYSIDEIKNYARNYLGIKMHNSSKLMPHEDKFDDLRNSLNSTLKNKSRITIWQLSDREDVILNINNKILNLTIEIPRKRLYTPTTTIFIAWMFGVSTIFVVVSLLFTKNQIKAIERLAEAAQGFGQGRNISDFKPEGASEVKNAGYAFLDMKERIEEQINQKTQMLAGVSHDLRTPLTRMRLALAMLPQNDETREIESDISEMQYMINEYLEFAKQSDSEQIITIDIIELIKSIVQKYNIQGSKKISLNTIVDHLNISVRPVALKRAIVNIIDNALRYGDIIEIFVVRSKSRVSITVEDNGPGIPIEEHEKIFSAFYRADYSRNLKNHSGAGLGLAITRDIINSHGGTIKVNRTNIKLKGASIEIKLKI